MTKKELEKELGKVGKLLVASESLNQDRKDELEHLQAMLKCERKLIEGLRADEKELKSAVRDADAYVLNLLKRKITSPTIEFNISSVGDMKTAWIKAGDL